MVEHNDVTRGRPGRGEEQGVCGWEHGLLRHKYVPSLEDLREVVVLMDVLVGEGGLFDAGYTRSNWVDQHFSRSERNKRAVDVHGVLILEVQDMDIVLRPEVSPHPFNAEQIRHLTALREDIFPYASEICRIKCRFEFCNHVVVQCRNFKLRLADVKLVGHGRFRRSRPFCPCSNVKSGIDGVISVQDFRGMA